MSTIDGYAGVVYDLDGTLVHLDVDWGAVAHDVQGKYKTAGQKVPSGGLWGMLGGATEAGLETVVEETIAEHERVGARSSQRLPLADDLLAQPRPVAVCSLNAESACRVALETHGLAEAVDIVIGRDSVATHKPDPEPLLAAVSGLGLEPAETVFVGDSPRDEQTAKRAGTPFMYVSEYRTASVSEQADGGHSSPDDSLES